MLVDPGGFPLRTLGHVEWTSCTTRRLAWSFTRSTALELCRGSWERMLWNMLNDLAEAIRRWTEKKNLICLRVLWWDVSVLWGQYLHHRHRGLWIMHLILWCAFYRSWDDFDYLYEDDIVLARLWSTLWIGYYSGRKTSAIQLYLADLHWHRRIEHSILHWSWKLWNVTSMWRTDLEKEELCVPTMVCSQKKVVQTPYVNHFVLEKLVSLWLVSWLFTFGWEPVCSENFWKCFDDFEFI